MNWVAVPRNIIRHSLSDVSYFFRIAFEDFLTYEVDSEPAILLCALNADRLVSRNCYLVRLSCANKSVSVVLYCSIILKSTISLLIVAEANI